MDAADDRLRSAVLAGVAVAALAVGGWWWRAAAPETTAGSARPAATPSTGPSVSTALERLVASGVPEGRVTFRVDPESGDVVEFERRPAIDPQTRETLGSEDAPGDLPVFLSTIWREQREVVPGEDVTRQATDDGGAHYVLQYRCTRPGMLAVTSTGAEIAGPARIDCDGAVATADVLPGSGPFRVSLSAVGDQPIDVEAQLVSTP
ncbi:hypothetical protein ACGFIE_23165 [Micromonospora sp. NPDC049275]|uniref:hypothetical protein n=1 Tax=Micromonospora sp. NPDC049275 TaxID=3364268 RepID=UPI003719A09F